MKYKEVGFTLIELLVVIAIIAILAALVTPVVSRAMESGRSAACKSNLHGIGLGFRMYLNDSGEMMPVAAAMPSLKLSDEPAIAEVLENYVSPASAFRCPSDTERRFYESEGASYEYHTTLGGGTVSQSFLSKRFDESKIWVMHDYEPYHGDAGQPGAANYLFGDLHVGDLR